MLIDNCRPPLGFREIQTANLVGWQGERAAPALTLLTRDIQRYVSRGQPAPTEDAHAETHGIGSIIREMQRIREAVDALGKRAAEDIEGPGRIPGGLIRSWRDEVENARREFDRLREQVIGMSMSASEKAAFLAETKDTGATIDRVKQYVGQPM